MSYTAQPQQSSASLPDHQNNHDDRPVEPSSITKILLIITCVLALTMTIGFGVMGFAIYQQCGVIEQQNQDIADKNARIAQLQDAKSRASTMSSLA